MIEETGWSLEEIGNMTVGHFHEYLHVRSAKNKLIANERKRNQWIAQESRR